MVATHFCLCCYRDSQEEHIIELMCTVEVMKLKTAQLKKPLSTAWATGAKPNYGCKDDGKIHCDWQLIQNRGPGLAETEHQHY